MIKENKIPLTKMPERFVLDKGDINYILTSVKKHWNRSEMTTMQNASYGSIMTTMQALVSTPLVNIVTLKNIYFSVQEAAMQLATLNQLKISVLDAQDDLSNAKTEEEKESKAKITRSFEHLYKIQYNKVGSGKAFE